MLQIIGWLLCVYLVVKAFELIAMKDVVAYIGALIATVAAIGFFFMINEQVRATSQPFNQLGMANPYSSTNGDDGVDATAAADRAIENAQRALDEASK